MSDSTAFPAATTIAAAFVEVEPGGMRELHWHPNANEAQYYISGRARMTVYAADGSGTLTTGNMTWLGGGAYRLSLVDITHPVQFSIRDSNPTLRRTSAEWIVEAPTGGCPDSCHVLSMPDFGRLRFSGTWVTASDVRAPLDGSGFTHERETMITRKGLVRSVVSSTAPDGTSFTVVWKRP